MDSTTILEALGEIIISIAMLLLPMRIFQMAWRIPQGRSKFLDDAGILFDSMLWVVYVSRYRDKTIMIMMMQQCYLILFIRFTKYCLETLRIRFKDLVILIVEQLAVFIVARLIFIVHDPVKFGRIVLTVGTTYITLMRLLCEPRPASLSAIALSLRGVGLSIAGIFLSDIFIVIPNLIGGLLALRLLVAA